LDPGRIILIAISATPEIAAQLFSDKVNYVLQGRLEEIFDARFTYYINSIAEYFKQGIITPQEGKYPWIYTPKISDIQRLAEICRNAGFVVLTMWSDANRNWGSLMTDEIK
jgi:DNA-binding transcriptional MocR family regulator